MRAVIRAMLDDMPDPCDLHLERAADHPRAPAGRSLQVQVTRIRHVIQHRPYHCPHAAPYHGFNNYAAQSARKNPRSPGTQLNRFRRSEAATYDAIFDDLSSLITRSGRVRPLFRLDRVAAHPDPRVYEVVSNQIVASLRHCQSMAPDTFSAIRKSLPRDVRELGEMPIKFPECRAAVFKWEGRRPRGRWGRRRVVRSLRGVSLNDSGVGRGQLPGRVAPVFGGCIWFACSRRVVVLPDVLGWHRLRLRRGGLLSGLQGRERLVRRVRAGRIAAASRTGMPGSRARCG